MDQRLVWLDALARRRQLVFYFASDYPEWLAVLRRRSRMDRFDLSRPENELVQPLPIGAFRMQREIARQAQTALAL
jgi:hypothetical protein